jgi:predicted TIM-barrel fold metal-dependent hydrolase
MIWGSDWPVCNMVGGKNAWTLWQTVSERLLSEAGISAEEKEAIWSENSKRLYKINVLGNQSSRI